MSIVDQRGIEIEHIVKDAGSTDGTVEWLQTSKDLSYQVRKDAGMYDAINQGIDLAQGDIITYLNCDEQYLLNSLRRVVDFFGEHPNIDLVFGDVLLVTPDGNLIAYRKGYPLRWYYVASSHLYVFSCALFFRREIFDSGLRFDKTYKSIGDRDLVVRALRQGVRVAHLKRYLSVFTMTGSNLSANTMSKSERQRYAKSLPFWLKALRIPINMLRLVEKSLHGAYRQEMPISYRIYTDDLTERTRFEYSDGSFEWPGSDWKHC
jgi:glycosyltransferase involved in cell wall biosynthesis